MKEILSKKNIFFCILLVIPIFLFSFFVNIDSGDEIINFQSLIKMLNGYTIYKDFNVIVTPIFFVLGELFLEIFGKNILIFRIYNVLIFIFLFISIYLTLRKLKISKEFSIFTVLLLLTILSSFIKVGANYNVLAIAFYILGSIIYKREKSFKNIILQGTFMFIVFFTKQNIGVYYIVAIAFLNMLSKDGILENLKQTAKELLVFFILLLASSLVMSLKGNFIEFIDYVFLGMGDFASKNFAIAEGTEILILIYFLSSALIYFLYISFIKKKKLTTQEEKNLVIFSFFLNLTAFPILNMYHTSFAIILNLVMLIVILNKEIKVNSKILSYINIVVLICMNIYGISGVFKLERDSLIVDKISNYFGGFMEQKLQEKIELVDNYILEEGKKENRVVIISEKAALYMIPLNINNGDFDLAFVGNLGKNGESKLIEKVKNSENTKYLIDKNIYWQISLNLRNYIITNLEKTGDIGGFEIYE